MSKIETDLQEQLIQAAKTAFDLDLQPTEVLIELPKMKGHGDYATNLAMQLSRTLKQNPRVIAEALVGSIQKEKAGIQSIEIAGPGFINFTMETGSLVGVVKTILDEGSHYGESQAGQGISVDLEYVSANPTGDLHPGHARGAAIGDSVSRIMKMAGYQVTREYYVNDAGNQIEKMALSLQARYLQACGIQKEVPEEGYHGPDLVEIAQKIVEAEGKHLVDETPENLAFFRQYGLKAELKKLQYDLKEFRCEFDVWSSEQSIYDRGLVEKALTQLKEKGYTYEAEDALWLRTTDFKDDKDRVLVKSDGSYTYFMPDIAYHLDKLDRGYDVLVDFFGADHHGYVPRLKAAIQSLGYPADKLHVDIIQMARMIKNGEEFKLSKRSGKAVALRDLMEEAGVDALRYFFASRAADTQMDFDIDMATKQTNENPVYYAQYAHARMQSILRMGQEIPIASSFEGLTHPKESELLKHLGEFPSIVADAAKARSPQKMTNYITHLATLFHSFYQACRVVDSENVELSAQRLGLVQACAITCKNALELIGVSAPDHM